MESVSIVAAPPRQTRSVAWLLVVASAGAVLVTGLAATLLVFSQYGAEPARLSRGLWVATLAVCLITLITLGLRALRWVFLMRRADARVPIRDAYIGYLAGFSLLFAPLLLGEMVVRTHVLRRRGRVAPSTTIALCVWERLLDVAALTLLAGVWTLASGPGSMAALWLVPSALLTLVPALRRATLAGIERAAAQIVQDAGPPAATAGLLSRRAWLTALGISVFAWLVSGAGLWLFLRLATGDAGLVASAALHADATLAAAFRVAPGGVIVTGGRLVDGLTALGLDGGAAALLTLAFRVGTAGFAVALGAIFLLVHLRGRMPSERDHFDTIADAYDVQIPEPRRLALLDRKTRLMAEALGSDRARGLDVGCGQGWYVARMRQFGYDVMGIDTSEAQVARAAAHVGDGAVVRLGTALEIPAESDSFDFVYTINVLHHLPTAADQCRAFAEILRVLRPGGLVFLHEINTRNPLFRFYMGYVFPSINCIDEGVERWLLPGRLDTYTTAPVVAVHYFTFLPEFLPAPIVRALGPIERALERSWLAPYSAHYMAVLRKPA